MATNTIELQQTLSHLQARDITIKIAPNEGYTYPIMIVVTNGTLVNYDSATGVAIVNGGNNITVSAECAELWVEEEGVNMKIYRAFSIIEDGDNLFIE